MAGRLYKCLDVAGCEGIPDRAGMAGRLYKCLACCVFSLWSLVAALVLRLRTDYGQPAESHVTADLNCYKDPGVQTTVGRDLTGVQSENC